MEFRLREILTERGISIRSFAQKMGVVPNSLPLSVAYNPSLTSLQKYANLLNIPCVELVRKPERPTPVTDRDMTDKFELNEMALSNIKRIMNEKHLMQKQVADKAGMSVQCLGQTLKKNKMSITTLEKIASGLEIEAWTLLVDISAQPAAVPSADEPNAQLAVDNEPRADVNEMGTEPDLFTQIEEEPHEQTAEDDGWKALPDGCYAYGNVRIELFHGRITISEKPKPH